MSLPCYVIYIDELAYMGEHADVTEDTPEPHVGAWQERRQEVHPIQLGGEARLIEGDRNLASHVERILTAKRHGRLEFHRLSIRQLDVGDAEARRRKNAIDDLTR